MARSMRRGAEIPVTGVTEDITLIAVWGYKVTFIPNGGTLGTGEDERVVRVPAGEKVAEPDDLIKPSDSSFAGWHLLNEDADNNEDTDDNKDTDDNEDTNDDGMTIEIAMLLADVSGDGNGDEDLGEYTADQLATDPVRF